MISRITLPLILSAALSVTVSASARASGAGPCVAPDAARGCFGSIQAAIDAAQPGATIDVYPGVYREVAANRVVAQLPGTHRFGVFIDKDDVTIRGVDASGAPITRWNDVATTITTDATNAFGPSAIFVQADRVTLSGLGIGANESGLNKTIEVIGDGFSLIASDISDVNGSIYINDFRFDASALKSHVEAFRIEGNNFRDGVSVDVASGAGVSGPLSGRVIAGNTFMNSKAFPSIAFNGAGTGVAWFRHPVGAAVVEGNVFINTFTSDDPSRLARAGHIAVRGNVDRAQFDWAAYLSSNVFNQAYATFASDGSHASGAQAAAALRPFALSMPEWNACGASTCAFDMMRIGASAAGEMPIALAGDVTYARSGTLAPRLLETY